MIELISAAKVGKISETDVSLLEKVVSNQEKCVRNMSRGRLYRLELVYHIFRLLVLHEHQHIDGQITLSNKKNRKNYTFPIFRDRTITTEVFICAQIFSKTEKSKSFKPSFVSIQISFEQKLEPNLHY